MIDLTPLVRLGLLLVRPGTLVMTAPGLRRRATRRRTVQDRAHAAPRDRARCRSCACRRRLGAAGLPVVVAREMAIGLALALAIRALVAGAELAGHLAGFQMGFSYAAIVDPQSGVRNNVLVALYGNIWRCSRFSAINGHHAFLRALRDSYDGAADRRRAASTRRWPAAVTRMLGAGLRRSACGSRRRSSSCCSSSELALGAGRAVGAGAEPDGRRRARPPLVGLFVSASSAPAAGRRARPASSGTALQAGVRAAEAFR